MDFLLYLKNYRSNLLGLLRLLQQVVKWTLGKWNDYLEDTIHLGGGNKYYLPNE